MRHKSDKVQFQAPTQYGNSETRRGVAQYLKTPNAEEDDQEN
jgi:hypothetical protein